MKLRELKANLQDLESLNFILPNGNKVPAHFHITEAGRVTKDFVDCGGTIRSEKSLLLQLWVSIDFHHRLSSEKFLKILEIYERNFGEDDLEIEVEYQGETINKHGLEFEEGKFYLTQTNTTCLAKESCGIPKVKLPLNKIKELKSDCCNPAMGCC